MLNLPNHTCKSEEDYRSISFYCSEIPEFMEVTPALAGLKGNIECILASKLSTLVRRLRYNKGTNRFQAHQGVLSEKKSRNAMIIASIGLQQVYCNPLSLSPIDHLSSKW